jgi:hypothetical protein
LGAGSVPEAAHLDEGERVLTVVKENVLAGEIGDLAAETKMQGRHRLGFERVQVAEPGIGFIEVVAEPGAGDFEGSAEGVDIGREAGSAGERDGADTAAVHDEARDGGVVSNVDADGFELADLGIDEGGLQIAGQDGE